MTPALHTAAMALADLLGRENAALTALDLTRAASLLPEKQTAAAAFATALEHDSSAPDAALAGRLRTLAADNQVLLARALRVQRRVLATIARAVPAALGAAPRYGTRGALARPAAAPVVVSARV